MLGFTGGILQVALVPLDVANIRSDYGLSMYTAWMIVLITNVVMMILVVPFILFFYETDTEANILTRVADSICSYICFVMFFLAAWLIVHFTGNSYMLEGPVVTADFRLSLLSNQTLNSFGPLLSNGTNPNSRPTADHSGSGTWNPMSSLAVEGS